MTPVLPGVARLELRTPTLPPATHTNAWVLGTDTLTVVDPASPWDDERGRLFDALWARIVAGARVRRVFLTHHHHDHVSGAVDLRDRLARRGVSVPIAAHPVTADLLAGTVSVDERVNDGDDVDGLTAVWTPGHAPGHLCLAGEGFLVAGDMVAGVGTILLDPREGDLGDYLASLDRLASLGRDVLLPAHGPALPGAATVLSFYAAHRHQRSEQILVALDREGTATPGRAGPAGLPRARSARRAHRRAPARDPPALARRPRPGGAGRRSVHPPRMTRGPPRFGSRTGPR